MPDGGVVVDNSTLNRWVLKYATLIPANGFVAQIG
jgi:transposase-like protein